MIIEVKSHNKINYLLASPNESKKIRKIPLLIHLHGAGGRGDNINILKTAGPMKEIVNGRELPFVVMAPQCYTDTWFEIMEQLFDTVQNVISNENINSRKVCLSGVSMGGYAAWQLAMSRPEWFSALVVLCGGGMYWNAGKLKDMPIWAFHGVLDQTVYVTESINMINAVNKCGGNAKLTLYPQKDHNCWDETFANDELYSWLLQTIDRG